MKIKQKIADAFVNYTHEWNLAMHNAIERRIFEAHKNMFPHSSSDEKHGEQIESMRTFYYQRMVNTASILLTGVSLVVAVVALLVAMIAIHFS